MERVWLGAPEEQSLAVVRLARGDIKEVQDYFFGYTAVVVSGSGQLAGEVLPVRDGSEDDGLGRVRLGAWVGVTGRRRSG